MRARFLVFGAVVMALALCVHALGLSSTSIYKPLHTVFSESAVISVAEQASFTSFAVTGTWEGRGSAKIFLFDGKKTWLVADTSSIAPNLMSVHLSEVCDETCDLPGIKPVSVAVEIVGTGKLTLDSYSFNTDTNAAGLIVG